LQRLKKPFIVPSVDDNDAIFGSDVDFHHIKTTPIDESDRLTTKDFLQSDIGEANAPDHHELKGLGSKGNYKYRDYIESKSAIPFGKFDLKNIQFSMEDFDSSKKDKLIFLQDNVRYRNGNL